MHVCLLIWYWLATPLYNHTKMCTGIKIVVGVLNVRALLGFLHRLSLAHHPAPVGVQRRWVLVKLASRRQAPPQMGWTVTGQLKPNRWEISHSLQSDLAHCTAKFSQTLAAYAFPLTPEAHHTCFYHTLLTTKTRRLLCFLHWAPSCVPLHVSVTISSAGFPSQD